MISFDKELNEIQEYIDMKDYDNATSAFCDLVAVMEAAHEERLPMIYYEFGMFLFDIGDYCSSVPYLIAAYSKDYEKQDILDFIYQSFVIPNKSEFEEAYENQVRENENLLHYDNIPSFDELPIDFIPVSDYNFYLFDRTTKQFIGNINYSENALSELETVKLPDEFLDITISGEWNLSHLCSCILAGIDRKLFVISDEPLKTLSFLKLPEISKKLLNNLLIFDSFDSYKMYLHNNPSVYLPRLQYAKDNNLSHIITQFLNDEHKYRLSTEGRNTDNLLLSICIPTWNRGNRALQNVKSLLELPYDSEIEIIVSNNGSEFYKDEYNEIQNLKDARLKYSAFETNQGFAANVTQVIYNSSAPFAIVISDEDSLISKNLNHYLSIIKKNPHLALVRPSSEVQYGILPNAYAKAGMPAFRESFLKGNYLSGFIYNTDLFKKLNIPYLTKAFDKNDSYHADGSYPHMWWNALLVFQGDYCSDNIPLINEGKSEMENQLKMQGNYDLVINDSLKGMPRYASIESRMLQHYGFISLVNILPFHILAERIEGYYLLCSKTLAMFDMVKNNYLGVGYTLDYLCENLQNCLIKGIEYLEPKLDQEVYSMVEDFCKSAIAQWKNYVM